MDTSPLPLLLQSAIVGLSIAAPVGPIGLLCIQRTLEHGPRVGLATGLGAATADAVYGAIGAAGVTALIAVLTQARTMLAIGGSLFLLWLAWTTWHAAAPMQVAKGRDVNGNRSGDDGGDGRYAGVSNWRAFGGTFLLTISNPATILSFIAVFSSLAGGAAGAAPGWMIGGVFLGSAAWWLLLVALVAGWRSRLQPCHLHWLRRGSAITLAGFALWQLAMHSMK